jgi:hypothetical protein
LAVADIEDPIQEKGRDEMNDVENNNNNNNIIIIMLQSFVPFTYRSRAVCGMVCLYWYHLNIIIIPFESNLKPCQYNTTAETVQQIQRKEFVVRWIIKDNS